jgi:hypothetical protein
MTTMKMMMMRTTLKRSKTTKNDRPAAYSKMQLNRPFPYPSYRGIMLVAFILAFQLLTSANPSAALSLSASAASSQRKPSPNDCIFYATVFTNQGRLLEGAEVHVRPNGKKHPDYAALSDRRGEFAVHVPPGIDYDISVKAEGFAPQVRTVNAQTGRQDLVFHMEPKAGKKP